MEWLVKNRTQIGTMFLSLLGAVMSLDVLFDGEVNWLGGAAGYAGIGAFVGGVTGTWAKSGAKRVEKKIDNLKTQAARNADIAENK